MITDQRNGLLFTNQNVAELVSACRRLLDDHVLACCFGTTGEKRLYCIFFPSTDC